MSSAGADGASRGEAGNPSLPPLPPSASTRGHSPVKQSTSADGQGWSTTMRRHVSSYLSGNSRRTGPTEVELAEITDGSSANSRDSSRPASPSAQSRSGAQDTAKQRPPPLDPLQCTYGATTAGYAANSDGGASSAGLPSALTTPKPSRVSAASLLDRLQAGLQLEGGAGGSSSSGRRGSDADADGAASIGARGGMSSDGESSRLGHSDSGLSIAEDSGFAAEGGSNAGRGNTAPPLLPTSGSEQLDKYLKYLLTEVHPHKFLYYPEWGVSEEACVALAEFMRHDRRIRVMTLSGNHISDEGAELLADGLRSNRMLASLDISHNKIGDIGALALAEALDHNTSLTELQLQSNRIGDEGAEALAAALSSNGTLKRLNLSSNPISAGQQRVVQHVLKTRDYQIPAQGSSSAASTAHQPSKPRHALNKQSLQFDIELSEALDASPLPMGGRSSSSGRLHVAGGTAIAALSEPTSVLESSLGMQVAHIEAALAAERAASGAGASSSDAAKGGSSSELGACSAAELVPILACKLVHLGYGVYVRWSAAATQQQHQQQQQESPAAGEPAKQQRHWFLRVTQPGEDACPVIVDPAFREQFQVSPSTARYTEALEALPRVLVLMETRLWHLTEALARHMAVCFEASQRPLPPWRSANSMVAKWLPAKYVDVVVDVGTTPQELQRKVAGMPGH